MKKITALLLLLFLPTVACKTVSNLSFFPTQVPSPTPRPTLTRVPAITPTFTPIPTFTPGPTGTAWPVPTLGEPCVSYYDETKGALKFVCREKNKWEHNEVVDSSGNVGLFSSLAFDHKGKPHISYYSQSDGDLKYASNKNGSWSIEEVDSADDVGLFTSLALDWDGNAYIAYYDLTNESVKLAYQQNEQWVFQTVEKIGMSTANELTANPLRISLVLDRSGNPLIAYHSYISNNLKMAHWTGQDWDSEVVDDSQDVGEYCSLALNSQGNPAISYHSAQTDTQDGSLKYAEFDGKDWNIEVVDRSGKKIGAYTSLAFDKQDNPNISYFDDERDTLKYAVNKNGTWKITGITANRLKLGVYSSIAIDNTGNPYIAYFEFRARDLRVHYWDGASKARYDLESNGSIGLYPSIKFIPTYSGQ